MSEHNMNHLSYLRTVADVDVESVLEKERTYVGSWKRQGGKNAWAMIRRKIDRLMIMLGDPKPPTMFNISDLDKFLNRECVISESAIQTIKHLRDAYHAGDVFAHIAAAPGGEDGTVLAEVRDLRRYLLLVEAEMMARASVPTINLTTGKITGDLGDHHFGPLGALRERADETLHASTYPWVITAEQARPIIERAPSEFDKFYIKRAADCYVLEPFVVSFGILREIQTCYNFSDENEHVLKIENCPPSAREYFPTMQYESNMMEHSQFPHWKQKLYEWSSDEQKYKLKNRAWHNEQ